MSLRSHEAIVKSIETDGFSDDLAPLIEALRRQWEAEDAVLLSMLPDAPAQTIPGEPHDTGN